MRITQILENSTTAGSVATVAQPMMTQTRESVNVRGLKPVKQVMQGKAKKQGTYANSISESKVTEDDLAEQDLIVIPGQGRLRGTGFTKHDPDRAEHEGQTLKNSLHTIIRLATHLDKELTVRDNFPEWVSEKVGSIKGDMLSVMNYIISSQEMRHDSDAMEGSENKYSNLSNRGVNRGINRAADDFDRMMDLDQAESPHYKTQHQQDTKQRLKTKPMAGPKGVLPEGSQRVDSIVTDTLEVMKHMGIKNPTRSDAVLAVKRVLGDRAYNERPGFYSFYAKQIVDMYSQQGVAEGEIDTSRMNKQHQDFYNTNPNFKRDDREATSVGGRLATIVTPKTAQVTKKPMTPFEGKIDFAKKLQGKVDKHNKAVVKTKKDIGSRVADIGAGGKEYNVKTDAAWDAAKKKVAESYNKKK